MTAAPIPRVGGRLLIVSPAGRLLLIHERIEGGTHWLTPGGGVEDGERPAEAAVREALEETGQHLPLKPGAAAVLKTRRTWSWRGTVYDQVDHFFVRRSEEFEPRPAALTGPEQETLLGFRWWSGAELRTTDAVLLPVDLADVLHRVAGAVASGPS